MLFRSEPFATVATILMYPQYWALRLTGVAASERTSLGCHTDLWNPTERDFSTLIDRMGWRKLFPSLRNASDVLGPILPEIAARCGLDPATPVVCGIHDSNASLLPHLLSRQPPFAVVSTGTWVVCMAVGGRQVVLDPARDTLVNVNALGDRLPSSRFMGGREFELLGCGEAMPTPADAVLAGRLMLLPSVQQGSGPFSTRKASWMPAEPQDGARRHVAASFYLAMMTATCLDLIGADGTVVVEGPFAANRHFCDMLGAATGRQVAPQAGQATGTSSGAALLAVANRVPNAPTHDTAATPNSALQTYAQAWRAAVSV